MANISTNRIPDINADWGNDLENGLPYSGEAVQEFIKDTFKSKYGYFHYDEELNRYLVFSDKASCDLYLLDKEANKDLLLNAFDAPFNYSATIELISNSYNAILLGDTGNNIQFKFSVNNKSGDSTGENVDCVINFSANGVKKSISKIYTSQQGREGVLVEIDDYLLEGVNNITISIKGQDSLAATTSSVVFQVVNLKFSDNFNISKLYNSGDSLEVSCVVEGAGTKIIDWYLDGIQLPFELKDEIPYITAYTVNKEISLKDLTPGVHSLQYRLRSQVGDTWFSSPTLFRNFFVSGVEKTIIGIATELPIGVDYVKSNVLSTLYGIIQYVPYNLRYAIYNPKNAAVNTVEIYLNNELQITTNIINDVENSASLVSSVFGNLPIKIKVNDSEYEMYSDVAISTIGVSEITDAKLNLRAFGKDNGSLDRESWTYGNYSTIFSGLYWNAQSGWVDNTLILNAGATASIDYMPFENDPMATGKTIEVEFATRNVVDNDGVILDLTNDSGHGLLITASEAKLITSDNKVVSTKFKSEEMNRISFVINRRDSGNNVKCIFIYINGILSGAVEYSDTARISVYKNIVFNGSSDILLKQIVIYDKPLSSDEILNNYILYRDSISEMLSIYNRNNVTTSDGQLSPEKLLNTLPVMYFTGLDENRGIPFLETQTGKAATKIDTYFDIDYQNAQDKTKNFKVEYARVRIQGTSSSYYPRKNYRFYTNKEDETVLYDWQGNIVEDRLYSFKDGAQPVDCWCLKTDYAESSGSHNTGVARLWNDVMKKAQVNKQNVLMTEAQKIAAKNGYPYDVRTTVDGFPIVVFYRNSYNHPWQFLGKFNFNNDKSTPSVFGFCDIPGFDNSRMQCWEVLNNGHALCNFTRFDDEYFDANWEDAFEARYDEDNPLIDDLKEFCRWIYSTKDNPEKFKTEKWDHLDVYKMAAYYVYIMRFGAVDQTVKNSMFTSEDGEHFYFINYDNDTIFGVRNDGLLKHGPYIDRQSIDPEKAGTDNPYVYAGHDSVLWNNLEADDEFMEVVKVVDSALHDAGLTYNSVINMFENEQTLKWCEKVCNTDAHYKYIAPPTGRVIESLQGNRNSHRRWWVSERFNLYDAKFITGDFKNYVVELKIVGEQIPFAKVTAAKRQPYGYEILNSASLVTDVLNIGESYSFVSPEGQTLQEGDPISIYSACNIQELDLSGCMNCALKVDLSRIHSPSVGNSLKRLIMNGNNNALTEETFTGTDKLTRLEYIDIQGLHKLGTIDLSNSLNLKTMLAKNSGLTSVKLAPGCLIERLELPTSTAALVLEDLPLLTPDNLVLEGDWCNVSTIKISNCPHLTKSFDTIWTWFNTTSNLDTRSLDLSGIEWTNVDLDQLLTLGKSINIKLRGKIGLKFVDDKSKLLELKKIFGNEIFDKNSDLYIYGPEAIYLFSSEYVLEGENLQLEYVLFTNTEGVLRFGIIGNSRYGTTLEENSGLLITEETGDSSTYTKIRVEYKKNGVNIPLFDDIDLEIRQRIYPSALKLEGPTRITAETTNYSWTSPTQNITGKYYTEWTLTGDIADYASISSFDENSCVLTRNSIPETIAMGAIKITIFKKYDNRAVTSVTTSLSLVNPDVIMTYESNPEVLNILYKNELCKSDQYLLKSEAQAVTSFIKNGESIFKGSNIVHFNEFDEFTGFTTLSSYTFSECNNLVEITLPNSLTTIEEFAFYRCNKIESVTIPQHVSILDQGCFKSCEGLTKILVDPQNLIYWSGDDGCVYQNYGSILYMLQPNIEHYVMPDSVIQVVGNYTKLWNNALALKTITFNSKITGISSLWWDSSTYKLEEFLGPDDNPEYSFKNGIVYSKDYSKMIAYPRLKTYSEDIWEEGLTTICASVFANNKTVKDVVLPSGITTIDSNAFEYSTITNLSIPDTITFIGERAFQHCSNLNTVDIKGNPQLGDWIFYSCSNITNVSLSSDVIGNNMFWGCSKLSEITLSDTVTTFGTGAFRDCIVLKKITIPETTTIIRGICFEGCVSLSEIFCHPMTAPVLESSVFGSGGSTYTGYNTKGSNYLRTKVDATGYDEGQWNDPLCNLEKCGFSWSKTL